MNNAEAVHYHRILVIDDNRAIHEDYRKILTPSPDNRASLQAAEFNLFGIAPSAARSRAYVVDSAYQGQEGAARLEQALAAGEPYAMAFVDMRMPPGWNGLETIARLWELQPDLQVVLCTAHSDYSLDEIQQKLPTRDRLLILKKPFDGLEVLQLAHAVTEKCRLEAVQRRHEAELEALVVERTATLNAAVVQLGEQARLIDLAHDCITVRDLDDRVRLWNSASEQVYGWPAKFALGELVTDLISLDAPAFAQAKEATLRYGSWNGEMSNVTKAGRPLTIASRWTLVHDVQGNPKSILVIDSDITERKQLELQLLRNQRLESIGTLASGLAHDLNNVLTPIMMSAPLLLHPATSPDQHDAIVWAVQKSAERGAQIVRQVLTFARGAEGVRLPLDAGALIREVAEIAEGTFPKNIQLRLQIAPELTSFSGDSTQWHQVLLNLAVNARDAMPSGGVLSLAARNFVIDEHYAAMQAELPPGRYLELEIADTGTGIPPSVLDRIFEPFFTTKSIGHGTGLGLSTTLGIVKSHGGVIRVRSTPGAGTAFQILLPTLSAEAPLAGESAGDAAPDGQGEQILVVDDEEPIRHAARMVFESHGYRVLLAADGSEALAVFAQNEQTIDLLLTDMTMPYLDGRGLIHAVRRMKAELPVVASTGRTSEAQLEELQALRLAGVLVKPYAADALLRTVHEALAGTRSSSPAQSR
jgi:two-component system cell cycle sensor histidine kinase/response regulator CckA